MKEKKALYVYYDADHNSLEVFVSLKKAKAYADEQWPDCEEEWDGLAGEDHWYRDPYQHIFLRTVEI